MPDAVIQYSDAKGYKYNETSPWWKQMCAALPCFAALHWPDYDTYFFDTKIDGKPVTIQLWKGWCQKFMGSNRFPGGVGAEVGVYHRVPGRPKPRSLGFMPPRMRAFVIGAIATLSAKHLWWPYQELGTTIEWTLVNPETNTPFVKHAAKKTYWACKWMNDGSYAKYQRDQGRRWKALPAWMPGNSKTPLLAVGYKLHYKINGKNYPVW